MDNPDFYMYKATVVSVYDGDTVRLDIDLGLRTWQRNVSVRLANINAPEMRGEERVKGKLAKAYLLGVMPVGSEVIIRTMKDKSGKYGRWVVEIYHGEVNVNNAMVESGNAKVAKY